MRDLEPHAILREDPQVRRPIAVGYGLCPLNSSQSLLGINQLRNAPGAVVTDQKCTANIFRCRAHMAKEDDTVRHTTASNGTGTSTGTCDSMLAPVHINWAPSLDATSRAVAQVPTGGELPNGRSSQCTPQDLSLSLRIRSLGSGTQVQALPEAETSSGQIDAMAPSTAEHTIYQPYKTSACWGVNWRPKNQRWEARLCAGGKQQYLGLFLNEEEAKQAYYRASRLAGRDPLAKLSSKYRGVTKMTVSRKNGKFPMWHARIVINGKRKSLGLFADEKEAGEAYRVAWEGLYNAS